MRPAAPAQDASDFAVLTSPICVAAALRDFAISGTSWLGRPAGPRRDDVNGDWACWPNPWAAARSLEAGPLILSYCAQGKMSTGFFSLGQPSDDIQHYGVFPFFFIG